MSSDASATTGGDGGGLSDGAGSGPGGPPGPNIDEALVYWLDIGLLIILGVFFLASLPRAFGRFSSLTAWTSGLILRSGPKPNPMIQQITPSERLHPVNSRWSSYGDGESDQSHTLAEHKAYGQTGKDLPSMPMRSGDILPPTHVRSFATVLHPISKIFTHPVSANKSSGKTMLTLVYIVTIIFIALNGNDPIMGPNRFGYIAVSQIPVAIALGTKNNAIGMVLGMGYEKLNFLHRLVGFIVFITATIHAQTHMFTFVITGNFAVLQAPFVKYGLAALIGVTILQLASGPVRGISYTMFLFLHVAGTITFFVGLWFHEPACGKYLLLAIGIYGIDHLFRIVKTRVTTARLMAVPELGLTRIEMRTVITGWRAGQHVRLRVLSGSMGYFGWTTAHPFTIASASDGKGLVLMCKKAGGWTRRLYNAASQTGTGGIEGGYDLHSTREMKVIVEGPYGGVGHMVMSSHSSALLIAGGSGIAFGLGAAEELVQDILAGRSAVKFIELVWITQEKVSLAPMLPTFSTLLSSISNVPGVVLRITTHYTRAEKPPLDNGRSNQILETHLATLGPNLTLRPGRPALQHLTSSIARLTAGVPNARGVAVGVCGPPGLGLETAKAVSTVDSDVRRACGGVELHQEVFGW